MSGTFKRISLKWCRLARLAGWHNAFLCLCWIRPLGFVFSFHPSQPGTGLVSFLWGKPQNPTKIFVLLFCLKTLSTFSSFLVLLATICQSGRKVFTPGPQQRVVEVDIRSFCSIVEVFLVSDDLQRVSKTQFLQETGTLLAVLT